jgi:hypothetical protein
VRGWLGGGAERVTCQTYKVVQDLITNDARHLEALLRGNRIDDHVAMNADKVLGVENAVFILQSGTQVSGFLKKSLSRRVQVHSEACSSRDAREASHRWGVDLG